MTGNPGALPDTGATRVRLRVQADVGHDSYRGPRLCGQRRVALTRHEQGEHDTPAHTGDGEQLLFAYPQRGMPLYRLGDGALPVGARIFQRLEQALHARPHGGESSGPPPKVLLRAALAFQPILHLVAPPPYLLELADRAGERLPDRERGLGAGSRAGQQQPVGRSSPVRLGCAPRPARERDWDDAPASRAADGPRGRTPARSLRSVRARGRPVPRLRPAAQTAFPLAGPLARSSGAVVWRGRLARSSGAVVWRGRLQGHEGIAHVRPAIRGLGKRAPAHGVSRVPHRDLKRRFRDIHSDAHHRLFRRSASGLVRSGISDPR